MGVSVRVDAVNQAESFLISSWIMLIFVDLFLQGFSNFLDAVNTGYCK